MNLTWSIAAVVAVALCVYLTLTLLKPEWFE